MSSGESSGISNGTKGTQGGFEQLNSKMAAKDNEERIEKLLDNHIDFYANTNGKALPAKYKNWIGVNKRDSLLKKAKNPLLKNAVNQLFRNSSFIGDGGTASVIKFEKRTGINLGNRGNNHMQKGSDMVKYLRKILLEPLSASDRKLATKLLKSLQKAMAE